MRKLLIRVTVAILTLLVGLVVSWSLKRLRHPPSPVQYQVTCATPEPDLEEQLMVTQEQPFEYLLDDTKLSSDGYVIEKVARKDNEYVPDPGRPHYEQIETEYISIRRSDTVVRNFDAGVFGGLGQSASFGFFPFLGQDSKELFISQDMFRGGCQWIVSLSPHFRVLFDGQKYRLGRESADLQVADLDHDQVKEILVPITDFYNFQDKMSISQIPLPEIIFKFDPREGEYLPANHLFKRRRPKQSVSLANLKPGDEMEYRSATLDTMAHLIYEGERDTAWRMFDTYYKLSDKSEMKRRVKALLKTQAVYNFIYNNRKR